jgi:mono/diheme cytochrome c family protein
MKRRQNLLIGVWSAMLLGSAYVQAARAPQSPTTSASQPADYRAVLNRYCVTCHNQRLKTAGLALDTLEVANASGNADVWEKVIQKLRLQTMPPAGLPRPDRATYDALAASIETAIDRAAAARPNPGRTESVHRLNRAEYQNAVRDLLGVEVDVSSLLPADDADQHGFDNVASVLSVSPTLLERYLHAGRKIARMAAGRPSVDPVSEIYTLPLLRHQNDRMSEDLPFGSRGGTAIRHYFPVDGEYTIKIRLLRTYVDCIKGLDHPHELEIRLDGARIGRFTVGGERPGKSAPASFCGNLFGEPEWEFYVHEADAGLELRFAASAGRRLVGVSFVREQWETDGILQPRLPTFSYAVDEAADGPPSVDQIVISGPFGAAGSQRPGGGGVSACRPERPSANGGRDQSSTELECARQMLTGLARSAYRRPVTESDLQTLLEFYESGRRRGSFETGIQAAIERILVAPDFLFRFEPDPKNVAPGTVYRVSDLELASRLSFFLWSSIPDNELLDLAIAGKLQNPAVLGQQVRRMLADRRSNTLVENFVGQWLELRNLRNVSPDPELFQDFDENLREAFQRETELFFESQFRDDRSVIESLTADYTFLNERLARHYHVPGVYGSRFRRVALPDDPHRAGFLSHGGLLTVTSYPNRTSPVLRGKWVLNNLLGAPPPPPPPDVPGLPDRGEGGKPASVRERLEQHRKNPLCATCHNQMDPLGFALENFDPIGRWRETDAGSPIDASSAMPGGSRFEGPAGLRDLLLDHREQFVGTVTEKMLAYALGRGLQHFDRPVVRSIVREAAAQDFRWSSVILAIVRSAPFQMRKTAG